MKSTKTTTTIPESSVLVVSHHRTIPSYRTPLPSLHRLLFDKLARNVPCFTLAGYQRVVKGHYRSSAIGNSTGSGGESQYVVIFLVVFRLEEKNSDIVV